MMLSPSDVAGIILAIKGVVDQKRSNDKACRKMYQTCEGSQLLL